MHPRSYIFARACVGVFMKGPEGKRFVTIEMEMMKRSAGKIAYTHTMMMMMIGMVLFVVTFARDMRSLGVVAADDDHHHDTRDYYPVAFNILLQGTGAAAWNPCTERCSG